MFFKNTFPEALTLTEEGFHIARAGWNGKGMYVFGVEGISAEIHERGEYVGKLPFEPFLVLKTADNKFVPWVPSQADMIATDWAVVGEIIEPELLIK